MQNRIINITEITPLVGEPVSITEAKNYLHIDFSNDDTFVALLITAARKRLERYTGLSFGSKTIKVIMEIWAFQLLPYGKVRSITSALREGDSDTNYKLVGDEFHPEIGGKWEVTYTTSQEVADDLKLAILAEVAFRYENRGDDNLATLSTMAKDLAMPYKNLSWV